MSALLLLLPAATTARQDAQSAASLEAAAKEAEGAGRLKDAFDLYVRAVQALPDPAPFDDDVRLRERIVALAVRIDPRPVVPEDAVRLQVRGQVRFKDAKDEKGFEEAATELRKAVRAAPWAVDFAYNLALVQEKLEYYRAAAANLKLYEATNPSDVNDIRTKIYELELRREENAAAASKEDCEFGNLRVCSQVALDYFRESNAEWTKLSWASTTDELGQRAYRFARKACDGGDIDACGSLGSQILHRATLNHSVSLRERLTRQTLGRLPHAADLTEAIGLLAKSCGTKASRQSVNSCNDLANLFSDKLLIPENKKAAAEWRQQAAQAESNVKKSAREQ